MASNRFNPFSLSTCGQEIATFFTFVTESTFAILIDKQSNGHAYIHVKNMRTFKISEAFSLTKLICFQLWKKKSEFSLQALCNKNTTRSRVNHKIKYFPSSFAVDCRSNFPNR